MMTALRRWSQWAIAAAMVASSGCGQPPPMVTMAPPGSKVDPLAIDVTDDQFKARAIGETPAARAGATTTETGRPAGAAQLPQIVREPTELNEEVELENGIRYSTLKLGNPDGPMAEVGDTVHVFYRGTLEDGTEFDSNIGSSQPAPFPLAPGNLIQGWIEGIPGMRVGERRRLSIPPRLGYGDRGAPPRIPPNAPLEFEVELVEVRKRGG